jgi:hypothetical protein
MVARSQGQLTVCQYSGSSSGSTARQAGRVGSEGNGPYDYESAMGLTLLDVQYKSEMGLMNMNASKEQSKASLSFLVAPPLLESM